MGDQKLDVIISLEKHKYAGANPKHKLPRLVMFFVHFFHNIISLPTIEDRHTLVTFLRHEDNFQKNLSRKTRVSPCQTMSENVRHVRQCQTMDSGNPQFQYQ